MRRFGWTAALGGAVIAACAGSARAEECTGAGPAVRALHEGSVDFAFGTRVGLDPSAPTWSWATGAHSRADFYPGLAFVHLDWESLIGLRTRGPEPARPEETFDLAFTGNLLAGVAFQWRPCDGRRRVFGLAVGAKGLLYAPGLGALGLVPALAPETGFFFESTSTWKGIRFGTLLTVGHDLWPAAPFPAGLAAEWRIWGRIGPSTTMGFDAYRAGRAIGLSVTFGFRWGPPVVPAAMGADRPGSRWARTGGTARPTAPEPCDPSRHYVRRDFDLCVALPEREVTETPTRGRGWLASGRAPEGPAFFVFVSHEESVVTLTPEEAAAELAGNDRGEGWTTGAERSMPFLGRAGAAYYKRRIDADGATIEIVVVLTVVGSCVYGLGVGGSGGTDAVFAGVIPMLLRVQTVDGEPVDAALCHEPSTSEPDPDRERAPAPRGLRGRPSE
jgi:hypothetical protein